MKRSAKRSAIQVLSILIGAQTNGAHDDLLEKRFQGAQFINCVLNFNWSSGSGAQQVKKGA